MASETIVPLDLAHVSDAAGMVVRALDARAARLSLAVKTPPLCCARGAAIDARKRLAIAAALPSLAWSSDGPFLDAEAPSGVVERLAERDGRCDANDGDPVYGEGCRIRAFDATLLPPGCALFPLDLVDGVLVPSPRIEASRLIETADHIMSLWDDARPRFSRLFGVEAEQVVSRAAAELRGHRARNLHLRTLR